MMAKMPAMAILHSRITSYNVCYTKLLRTDNQGNLVLAEGESLEQLDLDGFAQFGSECKTCMYWWNENITAELPELEQFIALI